MHEGVLADDVARGQVFRMDDVAVDEAKSGTLQGQRERRPAFGIPMVKGENETAVFLQYPFTFCEDAAENGRVIRAAAVGRRFHRRAAERILPHRPHRAKIDAARRGRKPPNRCTAHCRNRAGR